MTKKNPELGPAAAVEPSATSKRGAGLPQLSAPLWARLTATFFGAGYLRPGPGSWGSAAAVLMWWIVAGFLPSPLHGPILLALIVLSLVLGIPAATRVARASASKDPQIVVIDEVSGQLISLIGAPLTWKSLLAGFILFRAFDIVKPPPVRYLERLPEGVGIVLDDVAAGLYALVVVQVLLHFRML